MKIWILYRHDKLFDYQHKRFLEEAEKLSLDIQIVAAEDFEIIEPAPSKPQIIYQGDWIDLPDVLITRQPGFSYFAHTLVRHLARRGVSVFNNSAAIYRAEDKMLAVETLAYKEIPQPKTLLIKSGFNVDVIERELEFPVVAKTTHGMKGLGVFLLENRQQCGNILGVIETLNTHNTPILLQEFIADSKGRDLRVFVIGNKAVAAVMRHTKNPDEFRANVALGGEAKIYELTPEVSALAVEVAEALGLEIAGVDFLITKDELLVCEVNSNPGFDGFEQTTGANIPRLILEYAMKRKDNQNRARFLSHRIC